MLNKKLNLFVILLFTICGRLNAAPLAYEESVSGDLARTPDDFLILPFDIGVNTVSGDWSGLWPSGDADGFSFTVPDNAKVTGIVYEFDDSAVSLTEGYLLTPSFSLSNSASGLISRENLALPTSAAPFPTPDSPAQLFSDVWPLPSGTYNLLQNISFLSLGTQNFIAQGDGGVVPYTWSFTLESLEPAPGAVPVPAALWLFSSALIGLIAVGKRRRAGRI